MRRNHLWASLMYVLNNILPYGQDQHTGNPLEMVTEHHGEESAPKIMKKPMVIKLYKDNTKCNDGFGSPWKSTDISQFPLY
jgi:hypothetical protein